jgi:hypothetical protein
MLQLKDIKKLTILGEEYSPKDIRQSKNYKTDYIAGEIYLDFGNFNIADANNRVYKMTSKNLKITL